MEAIGFGRVVFRAWRDSAGFLIFRPGLSLVASVLILLVACVSLSLSPGWFMPHPVSLSQAVLAGLMVLLGAALKIGLTVQVYRYVLLGRKGSRSAFFGQPFWRYIGTTLMAGLGGGAFGVVCGLVLAAAMTVILVVVGFGHSQPVAAHDLVIGALIAVTGVLLITALLLFAPTTLLLSHAAANRRFDWRAAIHDARGHFWSIAGAYFVATLPLLIASIPVLMLLGFSIGHPSLTNADVVAHPHLLYATALVQTVLNLVFLFVNASCSAWLYRRFANQLLGAYE